MSYKDILVYLDPSDDTANRMRLAADLARLHRARLIGVDVCSDAAFTSEWRDRALVLQDRFTILLRDAGVRGEYRTIQQMDHNGRHLYAHYADLIVASRLAPAIAELVVKGVPDHPLMAGGVPVLLLPEGWTYKPVGKNVVVAWKGSREATRAVHDSLPILQTADKVTVFTFDPETTPYGTEADFVAEHLRHHGVQPTVSTWLGSVGEMTPVEGLFACLETQEADLIVAGAYGHSRLIEGLFGGASRDLTEQPLLPVLMSH